MFDIYLASPYSHHDPEVQEVRYKWACHAAGYLISKGLTVFSPIAHGHSIATGFGLPGDWDQWKKIDQIVLPMCDRMVILAIDGWKDSKGILAELQMFKPLNRSLALLRPDHIHKNYELFTTPMWDVMPLLQSDTPSNKE